MDADDDDHEDGRSINNIQGSSVKDYNKNFNSNVLKKQQTQFNAKNKFNEVEMDLSRNSEEEEWELNLKLAKDIINY